MNRSTLFVAAGLAVFMSLLTALALPAAAANPTEPVTEAPLSIGYDCAHVPGVDQSDGLLVLNLGDATSKPNERNLAKLYPLACRAAAAARRVAENENIQVPWVSGLAIILVDKINGRGQQAAFARLPLRNPSRVMNVTLDLLKQYSEKELLFTLGHELGHGVYGHAMKKSTVRAGASFAALVVGFGGGVAAKGILRKTAAVGAGAGLAAVAACGPGKLNVGYEIASDAFGVNVLVESGVSLDEAKTVAIGLFERNKETEPGCIRNSSGGYGRPNENIHPATTNRVKAVENMN